MWVFLRLNSTLKPPKKPSTEATAVELLATLRFGTLLTSANHCPDFRHFTAWRSHRQGAAAELRESALGVIGRKCLGWTSDPGSHRRTRPLKLSKEACTKNPFLSGHPKLSLSRSFPLCKSTSRVRRSILAADHSSQSFSFTAPSLPSFNGVNGGAERFLQVINEKHADGEL